MHAHNHALKHCTCSYSKLLRKLVQLIHVLAPSSTNPPPFLPSKEQQPPIVASLPKIPGLEVQPLKHCSLGESWAYAKKCTQASHISCSMSAYIVHLLGDFTKEKKNNQKDVEKSMESCSPPNS